MPTLLDCIGFTNGHPDCIALYECIKPSSGGRPTLAEPMQPRRPNPSVIPYSGNEVFKGNRQRKHVPRNFSGSVCATGNIGKRWNHTSEVSPGPLGAAASAVATGWFHRFCLRVHFWIPEGYFCSGFGSVSSLRGVPKDESAAETRSPDFYRITTTNMPSA